MRAPEDPLGLVVPDQPRDRAHLFDRVPEHPGGAPALEVARIITGSLGRDAGDVLAEISDDAPVLANMAGRLAAGGSLGAAQDAMSALEARKNKEFKPVALGDAVEAIAARDWLGGAYLADGRAEAAVREEARLIFEKRARDRGLTGDLSADPEAAELYRTALDEAAGGSTRNGQKYGGVDEVNGSKVIVPPDVRAGEVEDLLHRLADLSGLPPIGSANGVPVRPAELQGARLVSVGAGRWRVALGDPRSADPRYLATPAGDFYTLSIEDLRRAVPARDESWRAIGDPMGTGF